MRSPAAAAAHPLQTGTGDDTYATIATSDQSLGLTDATLMALAERLRAPVLTLDWRHFGLYRDRRGKPLELLPATAR